MKEIDIGTVLRKQREFKRFSMEYVADCIGTSYQSYQGYESGKTKLIHPALLKICEVLEIDLFKLFLFHYKSVELGNVEKPDFILTKKELVSYLETKIELLESKVFNLVAENAILAFKLEMNNK